MEIGGESKVLNGPGQLFKASYKIVGNFSTKCFQFGDTFVIDFCNLCLVHVLFMNPELAHSYLA